VTKPNPAPPVRAVFERPRRFPRLARLALIENTVVAPLPFEANAWRLTASGIELERAIPDDSRATAAHTSRTVHRPATTKENR
jgi:hypothetical protein